jgi:hypothetical protein
VSHAGVTAVGATMPGVNWVRQAPTAPAKVLSTMRRTLMQVSPKSSWKRGWYSFVAAKIQGQQADSVTGDPLT